MKCHAFFLHCLQLLFSPKLKTKNISKSHNTRRHPQTFFLNSHSSHHLPLYFPHSISSFPFLTSEFIINSSSRRPPPPLFYLLLFPFLVTFPFHLFPHTFLPFCSPLPFHSPSPTPYSTNISMIYIVLQATRPGR